MSGPVHACVVLLTTPVVADAERIVHALVEEELVACGTLVPAVTSMYRWEGKIMNHSEVLVLLKTTQTLLPRVTERVAELHPYDVPEIIGLPVLGGLAAYLAWVEASTGGSIAGEVE